MLGDIGDGFHYIAASKSLAPLLLLLLVDDSLIAGFFQMLPAFATTVLGSGVVGMSYILAARGLGATVSALVLAHGKERFIGGRIVLWAFLASLLSLAAIALSSQLAVAVFFAFVLGLATETRRTGTVASIQLSVDEAQRGRVMGTLFMLSQFAAGSVALFLGAASSHMSLSTLTAAGVAVGTLTWAVMFVRRDVLFPRGTPD